MGRNAVNVVEEDFSVSGPTHLDANAINWAKPDHQCSVMACLVQATYVLESDRKRKNQEPLAPVWWKRFGFELIKTFVDDKDSSIFGAIFRNTRYNDQTPQAPRFVITFRGTMLEGGNLSQDLSHDLLVGDGGLGSTSRLKKATQYVDSHISEFGSEGIFLAGHSLGSSMAMLVGANMATKGIHIKTFLFNLPSCLTEEKTSRRLIARFLQITPLIVGLAVSVGIFPIATIASLGMAASVMMIDTLVVASGIATLTSLAALIGSCVLAMQKRIMQGQTTTPFTPYLFVNPGDPVCKNWVAYFRNHLKEKKRSPFQLAGFVEKGVLSINSTRSGGFLEAHGLKQWWQQGMNLLPQDEYRLS
ncbi:GDSL esterase/lipase At4g10955-like [Carex rostrata]